jgi:predicted nuclease of predicted toxin-antitoxin system
MPEVPPRRILLDENIDRQLRTLFDPAYDVATVRERGWAGLQNGELLRAAATEFDVFVTMDRNLPYQQNLRPLHLAVIVIRAVSTAFVDVAPLMPRVNEAVATAQSGTATLVSR